MREVLYVGVCGMLGVICRYLIGILFHRLFSLSFPFETLFVNLLGSLLIGILYVLGVENSILSPNLRLALMTGFLGGFTTFSAFSLETFTLFKSGSYLLASSYLFGFPLIGAFTAFLAILMTRRFI